MSETMVETPVEVERPQEEVPILFLHDVERHYRQGEETLYVLNGVELALWAGQSVALVAPSGAGKSTLLHIAGLLEHPDRGDVYIDGRSTAILPDHERTRIRRNEIGFVYQSHHLLPEFSALENVLLPQMIRGLGRREAAKRATELLTYLGLRDRLTHRPAELSGGEQQRVALARALINKPAIVLADEPTGNLDSKNSEIVLNMLRHSNRELGQTVLMITHNPEAAAYGDRIFHMRDGQIVTPEKDPQWIGHKE